MMGRVRKDPQTHKLQCKDKDFRRCLGSSTDDIHNIHSIKLLFITTTISLSYYYVLGTVLSYLI